MPPFKPKLDTIHPLGASVSSFRWVFLLCLLQYRFSAVSFPQCRYGPWLLNSAPDMQELSTVALAMMIAVDNRSADL